MASTSQAPQAKILNTQFLMLAGKLQANLSNLAKPEDKQLAIQWADRLKRAPTKISELQMRRKIMMFLVMQSQAGALTAPFDKPPAFTKLEQIASIVPDLTQENVFPEDFKLPIIMENSPDHGAFLVSQPIPKCGAFCYLAVVARPNK